MRPSLDEFVQGCDRVSADQFRDARRTQKFFGGSILANLVRLRVLSEAEAGKFFADWSGYPIVAERDLTGIPEKVIGLVRPEMAARRQVMPFRWDSERLCVATSRADNETFFAELERRLGTKVVPHAIFEDRLMLLLESYYGIDTGRRPGVRVAGGGVAASTPSAGATAATAAVEAVELGIDGLPLDVPAPLPEAAHTEAAAEAPPDDEDGLELPPGAAQHLEALAEARDREDMGQRAVELALSIGLRRVLLFGIQKERLTPWNAGGEGVDLAAFSKLSIPLYASSIFASMRLSTTPYVGILPDLPVHRELLSALHGASPGRVAALPIAVRGRTAAAIYADRGAGTAEAPNLRLLGFLASKVALALEILLLRRKILS